MTPQSSLPAPAGPYSLVRRLPTGLMFVAGQTGVDPATQRLVEGGIEKQTAQAIDNIAAILASEGATLDDVVKVSVFLANLGDFAAMNEVYASRFGTPYPARTTVEVGLSAGDLIEIDAIAFRP